MDYSSVDDASTPQQESLGQVEVSSRNSVTPWRCFTGAFMSAPIAIGMYFFTVSISQTFASKPPTAHSALAIRISVMVRTLVIGMSALGTMIFTFTTLGVIALGIQLLLRRNTPAEPPQSL
ncbi:MAG: DUF3082 domain-containing protein [Cyanothece sp. SIO2G6]|nr:DUF3082 domain-containing protein [Cyanothece sp. SIO2G6]